MLNTLPESIRRAIDGHPFTADSTGCSGAQVLLFPNAVLKIRPDNHLAQRERTILQWLDGRIPAPKLLAAAQQNGLDYLLMSRLQGRMLCEDEFLDDPSLLCQRLAEGMQITHHAPADNCPITRSLEVILREAETRLLSGLCTRADWKGFPSAEALLRHLQDNRPEEHLVFTHGDYCLPNVLADDHGVCGLIDLGDAGLADPYLDIALGYQSLMRNLSGFFGGPARPLPDKRLLFDCMGIAPDWDKLEYYLLLDMLFD